MRLTMEQLERMIALRSYYDYTDKKKLKIFIHPHAFERWGERVSKTPVTLKDLERTIRQLYAHGRVEIHEVVGKIDGDIVFTYEKTAEEELMITTFYGRVSNQPALANWKSLRRYNEHNGEQLNLCLLEKELEEQAPVVAAKKVMKTKVMKTKYIVEVFQTDDKGIVYIVTEKVKTRLSTVVMGLGDLDANPVFEPEEAVLNKIVSSLEKTGERK